MSRLSEEDVNKIIREFMGQKLPDAEILKFYTTSIDRLIPVWDEIKRVSKRKDVFDRIVIDVTNYSNASWFQKLYDYGESDDIGFNQSHSLQLSLAKSTAEFILTLSNEQHGVDDDLQD